jgi:glutathione S-transferase
MKLYFFPIAPNPTKVRLYLAEKRAAGCDLGIEKVLVRLVEGEQSSPEHLARNPLGRLPTLELDDGSYVLESLAIIEYLEELHPNPPLIGRDPAGRARVRDLERIADLGVLIPVASLIHATNSPIGLPPNPEVAEFFRGRLEGPMRLLDERLADGRPFLAGEEPTIADCTLAAAFQFGRFREVEIDPAFQNVIRWDSAYREREPARAVLVM